MWRPCASLIAIHVRADADGLDRLYGCLSAHCAVYYTRYHRDSWKIRILVRDYATRRHERSDHSSPSLDVYSMVRSSVSRLYAAHFLQDPQHRTSCSHGLEFTPFFRPKSSPHVLCCHDVWTLLPKVPDFADPLPRAPSVSSLGYQTPVQPYMTLYR
jgi:hypothetical protein